MRFGLVGITATATHITTVLVLVEWSNWRPLWANFFAFSLALLVSFGGHYHWTFKASTPYASAFPRFSSIALLGLGLNQIIMFSVVSLLALNYRLGLAAVIMVVPFISFMANKLWAFQSIKD
jgi:putative flippase GtrA